MDYLTAYITIIGLLCNFIQIRKDNNALSNDDFKTWLEEHKFKDIVNLINENSEMSKQIDALIKSDHEILYGELLNINELLISISQKLDFFKPVTENFSIRSTILSTQAIDILMQLVNSGSFSFMLLPVRGFLQLSLHKGGSITYGEPDYIKEDLIELTKINLLRKEISQQGTESYHLTRTGSKFIQDMKKTSSPTADG